MGEPRVIVTKFKDAFEFRYDFREDGTLRKLSPSPIMDAPEIAAILEVARLQEENAALREKLSRTIRENATTTYAPAAPYYREPHCGGGICECGGCA